MSTEIYNKYIKGKSYKKLLNIRHNSTPGGEVNQQITEEIQRIQQDTNNIQIAKLIQEVQNLKDITSENSISSQVFANWSLIIAIVSILISLFIGGIQIYLAIIGVRPVLEQEYREQGRMYEFCKEPGNWNTTEGGSTPGSTCRATYIQLREKFGVYPPAEKGIK